MVLINPSEIWNEYDGSPWDQRGWIDGREMGNGLAGSWDIMVSHPIKLLSVLKKWTKTRGGELCKIFLESRGRNAHWETDELTDRLRMDFPGGGILFDPNEGPGRLRAYSQVPILTLEGWRQRHQLRHKLRGGEEGSRGQKIMIRGGSR